MIKSIAKGGKSKVAVAVFLSFSCTKREIRCAAASLVLLLQSERK